MHHPALPADPGMVFQENRPRRKVWPWACGGCALLLCAGIGIIGFLLYPAFIQSYPLEGDVSFPSTVRKGDKFEFVVTLTNSTTDPIFIKHFTLQNYIGAPSLLDAVKVMSVEPAMEPEPLFGNELQFPYFREIRSGESLRVIFHMQAENTGTFAIDVGVYARDSLRPDPAFILAFWFGPAEIKITP